jgi:DNA-binding transcriptional ArsR family regulator
MHEIDLERAQRESVRWTILRALDAGRPLSVSEALLSRTLNDASLHVTPSQLRRELDYLADAGLIDLVRERPVWSADLTTRGVDVVEYTIAAPPGINRPPQY